MRLAIRYFSWSLERIVFYFDVCERFNFLVFVTVWCRFLRPALPLIRFDGIRTERAF